MVKKVLITGAAGYIGSVLTRRLLAGGCFVRGLDCLSFGSESLQDISDNPDFELIEGNIKNTSDLQRAIEGIDSIVHLAAIVGDPACSAQEKLAEEVNYTASTELFEICKEHKVERFIFASTCSNYGRMEGQDYLNEDSPLSPISHYARLKVRFEKYLQEQIKSNLDPSVTILRFATAYGVSPRMRFDLTVNEFTRELTTERVLEVYGGKFWRPYCHVSDIAGACRLVLCAPKEKITGKVFGVGDTTQNYCKEMIVNLLLELIPDGKVKFVHKDEDPRNYKVDFSKIDEHLGFKITKTVKDGIREIMLLLDSDIIADPYSGIYQNVQEVTR